MTEDEAVAAARALIALRAAEARHHVACTVVAADGRHVTALNLESTLGRAAICAEAVAIGRLQTEAPAAVAFSVAVNRRGEVVSPCGLCRELLLDWGPEARVAVPGGNDYLVVGLGALMPHAWKAGRRGGTGT